MLHPTIHHQLAIAIQHDAVAAADRSRAARPLPRIAPIRATTRRRGTRRARPATA